nr:ABC transporter ATP-binding protein [uncultured Desulfobacter sp.]
MSITDHLKTGFTHRPPGGPGGALLQPRAKVRNTKETIHRLFSYLAQKRGMLVLVFAGVLASTGITIAGTRLSGYALDHFIQTRDIRGLAVICLILAGIYLINVFSTYAQNALMIRVAQRTAADLRRDLFSNLQKLPLAYFDTHSSGDLMSRLTNDVDNINLVLSQNLIQFFSSIVNVVGMLAAMFILSPLLTLIALATTPVSIFGTQWIAKKTKPYFDAQQAELGMLNGYIEEMVSGQKVVQLFSREKRVEDRFMVLNKKLTRSAIMAQSLSGVIGPVNNMMNNITFLIVTVCGAVFIIKGMNMTVGIIFTFLLYMRSFTRPVNDLLMLINTIQSALAGAERVFEIMDECPEHDAPGARDIRDISGNVVIDGIDFSYLPGKPVLKNASFDAHKGQTIAIVGPTGAGKTTIINLLTKFYDLDGGNIFIDGKEIRTLTAAGLRRNISIVLQDPFLFSETVRENIRYGRLNATDREVESAARMACAHEFIMQLPKGYDTVLGDNGENLSQGQRQLLSIARAIIADAGVLILDEATSSVDTRTEILIQNALLTLMAGKTSFVIAHRLSTIRNADKIVVIDQGRVVESGTHASLMSKQGFYSSLYNSQFD